MSMENSDAGVEMRDVNNDNTIPVSNTKTGILVFDDEPTRLTLDKPIAENSDISN